MERRPNARAARALQRTLCSALEELAGTKSDKITACRLGCHEKRAGQECALFPTVEPLSHLSSYVNVVYFRVTAAVQAAEAALLPISAGVGLCQFSTLFSFLLFFALACVAFREGFVPLTVEIRTGFH